MALLFGCQPNTQNEGDESTATTQDKGSSPEMTSPEMDADERSESSFNTEDAKREAGIRQGFEAAAREFMNSYREDRYADFSKYMHPAVVKAYGGPEAFAEQIKKGKKMDTQRYRKWESGPLEAFRKVQDDRGRTTGWYCVVPIKRWLEGRPESEFQMQWLGGQSLDGTAFHFIDITDGDKGLIYRIMPDMRFLLENLDIQSTR